jgi:hypothetical protein
LHCNRSLLRGPGPVPVPHLINLIFVRQAVLLWIGN